MPTAAEAGRLGAAPGPQLWTLLLHKFADWLQVLEAPTPQSHPRHGETFPLAYSLVPSIASFLPLNPKVACFLSVALRRSEESAKCEKDVECGLR